MRPKDYRQRHDDWTFRNVVHISHGDLFRGIDLERPALGDVKSAVTECDLGAAYHAWDEYFRGKKKHLDFFDPKEYRKLMKSRPKQARKVRKEADEICKHKIRWYGQRVEQFGDVVNFSPGTDRSGLYGFHYSYWAHPLLAYSLGRDKRFVQTFDTLFNQWYDQRDSVEWWLKADPIWYELGLCRTHRFIAFYGLFRADQPRSARVPLAPRSVVLQRVRVR